MRPALHAARRGEVPRAPAGLRQHSAGGRSDERQDGRRDQQVRGGGPTSGRHVGERRRHGLQRRHRFPVHLQARTARAAPRGPYDGGGRP